ncbi:MAG: SpoIIE family protein phosphatase [Lachnospiraceae bacterium]|nr:SpoIIE family protein phosphatase [Lachnospiraceae bacterium]
MLKIKNGHLFAKAAALLIFTAVLFSLESLIGTETYAFGASEVTAAVDPTEPDASFAAIVYDNTNGLPASEANDIVETEEGFIWIGSYSGLIRYDGNTFERIDSVATGILSVRCLFVDSRNRLWVGTNDNGVVMLQQDRIDRWTVEDGLPSSSIRSILEDERGIIYISTTGGIVTIDADMKIHPMKDPRMKGNYMDDLCLAKDGSIYGLSNSGDMFIIKKGNVVRYINSSFLQGDGAHCIFPDPEKSGYIYMETMDSMLRYGNVNESLGKMKKINIAPLSQVSRFECINGKIWVCARNGLGVIDENGFHLVDNLPMSNSVGRIMTDYAGNLWMTSTRQGVMKIVPNHFVDCFAANGLPDEVVNSTCMLDEKLFIGTDTGLKVLEGNGIVEEIPVTQAQTASGKKLEVSNLVEFLKGCRIRSIIRDSRDRLWISTWRTVGLLCYDHGKITAYSSEDGLFSDMVRTVFETEDGSFLAAVTGGVAVIKDGDIVKSYGESAGIENTEILTVAEGENGDILCGTDGGGIYIIGSSGIRHIGREEGLTSESVMRIKPDKKNGVYWIVNGTSLAYLTADYELHVVDQFPYTNNFDLYRDKDGDMWVLSGNGIYVVPEEDLLKNESIDPLHFGISDGLPCIATANSYSELTADGDLYISGTTGIARINVDDSVEGNAELKCAVPYLEADGSLIYPDESGDFTISPDVRKLSINAFVFNYSLVNPQIIYRLEGFDQENISISRSELDSIDYTNLRGGNYRFVMEVRDPVTRGVRTLSVNIVKQKAFYEQLWFYVLSGVFFFSMVAVFVRLYIKKRLRMMEKKNREQAEKERIAAELNMAKKIQEGALPGVFPAFPDRHDFDICATMEPAREVGGDFYDFFLIDDDHLCMVMADVSGKGIPAALFMMDAKSVLKSFAILSKSPGKILEQANEDVCAGNNMDMFVTVWLGILELSSGKLTSANAGHEYPALKRANGDFELIKDKHGFVIGGMEGMRYRETETRLQPGDKIFLYTDGIPEATDAAKELFGTERMIAALNANADAAPQQILRTVRAAVDEFVKDEEQFDDLTMLCMEYKGAGKE